MIDLRSGSAAKDRTWQAAVFGSTGLLILLALGSVLVHLLTNHAYGFHRDELFFIDNARRLDWGYVSYPPLTPFIARVALELFGPSLVGLRLFSSLAMSAALVLTGLMARELGGGRRAQVAAALAAAVAPIVVIQGALFQYVAFDYLLWVLASYLLLRLLNGGNPSLWLGIGAVLGLGMMNKYTMVFFIAGITGAVLLTPARRYLKSPWLWAGAGISLLIFLPNLIWQVQHDFISLEHLSSIHARDVSIGRTEGYLVEQLIIPANPFTIPFWVAGLVFYFFRPAGRPYRALGWMFVIPFILLYLTQGRSYYLAPAYPLLFAAGAVVWDGWLRALTPGRARLAAAVTVVGLALGGSISAALMLPIAPVGSTWWHTVSEVHDNFVEQIGWPEMVETVAAIYTGLPDDQRAQTGILVGNYGEAGAVNLYGPGYGLPRAISGVNSYWEQGYGDPPPQSLIVLGFTETEAQRLFDGCRLAGQISNRYGVPNPEILSHPDIFICGGPQQPWPEFWAGFRSFG